MAPGGSCKKRVFQQKTSLDVMLGVAAADPAIYCENCIYFYHRKSFFLNPFLSDFDRYVCNHPNNVDIRRDPLSPTLNELIRKHGAKHINQRNDCPQFVEKEVSK